MKIYIVTTGELLPRFFKLLEQGFIVKTQAGCSIKDLLCEKLGIDEEYLANRIQTLFLDGKPVDNVEKAYIQNDATLAISGAMPGLVGATFRKGGALSAMRHTISYKDDLSPTRHKETTVKLKLFNIVLKDLGSIFLESGIRISDDKFKEFLSRNLEDLKAACISIHLNDEKTNVAGLLEMNWENKQVLLQVTSEETG
ncbi:MAG: hypothetical protein KAS40_23840 [Desulfobacterales bacterium]|jgi:hypothetical protein|nr:hypothetical protein [Desulfobacterales bacterium]